MRKRATYEGERWLSLREAAARLGVHPVTLRRWADSGQIACMLTAGGHRRFAESELERFAQTHALRQNRSALPMLWAEQALSHARGQLSAVRSAHWLATLDEERREQHRRIGQRLVGLTLQYLSADDGEHLLEEARQIGREYAEASLAAGLPLSEALEAAIYFRDRMLEASLMLIERVPVRASDNARLVLRLNALLNAVQMGVVARYQEAGHA
ncbi:MAG: helix-turn-helix domain-containing protein [Anaerolineae bacterium]|nr:helix-turn-helix domain-containing protein [Thermoflexales bacterium]MDW8054292.1 helix-turn-helix domain-containing protein [Anaerolineae bacterium]